MSNDTIVMYGALAFAAVLAVPILRFLAKQLGQLSGAPGAGTVVGGGYGGKTGSFTLAEVAKHASKDDIWVVIKDKVYDLSDFIDEHPGGVESIEEARGRGRHRGIFRSAAPLPGPRHDRRVPYRRRRGGDRQGQVRWSTRARAASRTTTRGSQSR